MDILVTSLTEAKKIEPFLHRDLVSDIVLGIIGALIFLFMSDVAGRQKENSKLLWFYRIFAWFGFALLAVCGISADSVSNYKKSAVDDNEAYVRAVHIRHKCPHLSAYSKKAKTYHKLMNKSADRVKHVHRLSGVQRMLGDW